MIIITCSLCSFFIKPELELRTHSTFDLKVLFGPPDFEHILRVESIEFSQDLLFKLFLRVESLVLNWLDEVFLCFYSEPERCFWQSRRWMSSCSYILVSILETHARASAFRRRRRTTNLCLRDSNCLSFRYYSCILMKISVVHKLLFPVDFDQILIRALATQTDIILTAQSASDIVVVLSFWKIEKVVIAL